MNYRSAYMEPEALKAWRLQNPEYLYPGTLRHDWVPPNDWVGPLWRTPLVFREDIPPRNELVLFSVPPGTTLRRDFNTIAPGQVVVRRALPRPDTNTINIEEEYHGY